MTGPGPGRLCPCASGTPYDDCCGPRHDGVVRATTAEQLMRSRYAAYALGRLDYVFRTWHPRTRPPDVEPTPGLTWTGLTVLGTEDGADSDETGVVEFEARYVTRQGPGSLDERSRFVRRVGRWFYLDGEVS